MPTGNSLLLGSTVLKAFAKSTKMPTENSSISTVAKICTRKYISDMAVKQFLSQSVLNIIFTSLSYIITSLWLLMLRFVLVSL